MKNFFLSLLIIVVVYILIVFTLPDVATKLWTVLHLQGFNNFLISFKQGLNATATQMPQKQDFINTYNKTLSGATEVGNGVKDWVDIVKDKIDNLRVTLSGSQDQTDALKASYEKAKEIITTTAQQIEAAQKVANDINNISTNIINAVNTWVVQ